MASLDAVVMADVPPIIAAPAAGDRVTAVVMPAGIRAGQAFRSRITKERNRP